MNDLRMVKSSEVIFIFIYIVMIGCENLVQNSVKLVKRCLKRRSERRLSRRNLHAKQHKVGQTAFNTS